MKISLKWMQAYAPDVRALKAPVDEVVQKIGAQLGAVESSEDLAPKYHGVIVARIVSVAGHPNADKLHVCFIDDGRKAPDVPRNEQGYVQVVCGAPNVREGLMVAWLPPGTTVPDTYGNEPFVLEARELRGVVSNGMLASARELALGTDHHGILEVDKEQAQPGDDFATVYELNDQVIDIENKMFTHRPDCFGQLGVAREIAGIFGEAFHSPEWYMHEVDSSLAAEPLPLSIRNELPGLVPRFTAITIHGVKIGPSPLWLRTYLLRVGVRPISNVVDLTNYYMLLTGQPLHAYDYDQVNALSAGGQPILAVRYPHPGEQLTLLNGKTITPRAEAIMIATDQQAIGLGGVMGGADTEVSDSTTNIILECATFDMYSVRRTSMAHGLFTDAVTRYNKGQSPLQNRPILAKVAADIVRYAGGAIASDIYDDNHVGDRTLVHPAVPIVVSYINARLGLHLSAEAVKQLLENVEFTVAIDGEQLMVAAPFWRTDIELREDVVEEVGRLYGFDRMPLELPMRSLEPALKDPLLELKAGIRETLARSGANEVLTYSFVHGNLLDKVGQDKRQAFSLSNAISPDLQYYRLSLTPSLLDKVHANIKAGYDRFALFELGRLHTMSEKEGEGVPREVHSLALVVTAADKLARAEYTGAAYYQAQHYLSQVLRHTTTPLVWQSLAEADLYHNPWVEQMTAPFEPKRSAVLRATDGLIWGVVGEYKSSITTALKLPRYTAGFEIDPLLIAQSSQVSYTPQPRFPKVEQDICLKVAAGLSYSDLLSVVRQTVESEKPEQTRAFITPVDIYQRNDDKEHKQVTFRISIASYEKTMTDAEVAALLSRVATATHNRFQAERI